MSLMLRKWILNSIIKSQPARKPIAHLSRIESLPDDSQIHGHFKLACISDKEKFIRAVFTKDSLALFEEKGNKIEDIRGGLISLQDYAFIASVGTDRRFSEYFVEIHKFTFIGGERNMPIPTVTNINLDERVQSILAQVWREEHMDTRADSYQLRVYSQTEDAPQLSQDELSMLLVAMSENSQVDSIEAISSSQLFELENIPGWLKPEKDLEQLTLTQNTVYATPLVEGTHMTALTRSDQSSHDTPTSDGAFITPPEGPTSSLVTNNVLEQQQVVVSGEEVQWMDDNEEPLELIPMPLHSSDMITPLQTGETIQQMSSIERVKGMGGILEQAVQDVCEMLSSSNLSLVQAANNYVINGSEGASRERQETPIHDERDMDDFSYRCEISCSQVKDLNAVWVKEQPSLSATINGATEEQPCSGDILLASDTPGNSHNCSGNNINSNGCLPAASSRRPEGDQQEEEGNQQQQVMEGKQPTDKGKGGTTKNIHQVEKLYNTDNRSEYDNNHDLMDDNISISSSQKDELDRQWVVGDDEVNNSVTSSLEAFEDLHPFQLTSLPDPRKKATGDVQQALTDTTENGPGPSGVVTVDTDSDFILNQEAERRVVVSENDMDLDDSDQHLLSQVETVTPPPAKTMQTSLVSTAAITRLLDASNKIPPMIGAAIGDKTIPQSSAVTGNTRLTPARTTTSSHRTQLEYSKLNPAEDSNSHEKTDITTHGDSDHSSDIATSQECLNNRLTYQFKPLTHEEDIDEFIDNYWALQQLRTFSL